jgi:hypothetical protein
MPARKRSIAGRIITVWVLLAVAASLTPLPRHTPVPYPQYFLAAVTLLYFVALAFSAGTRRWTRGLELHSLTLFHIWRVLPGITFLILHNRRMLAGTFAVPAGWGDIIVGITAPFVAALLIDRLPVLLLWHLGAMFDLCVAVAIAAGFGQALPTWLEPLRHFPLSLLPLFLVPFTLQAHIAAIYKILHRFGLFHETVE